MVDRKRNNFKPSRNHGLILKTDQSGIISSNSSLTKGSNLSVSNPVTSQERIPSLQPRKRQDRKSGVSFVNLEPREVKFDNVPKRTPVNDYSSQFE